MSEPITIDMDVFYHSPAGMVLAEQHGPVFSTSTAPSPFHYVRLIDAIHAISKAETIKAQGEEIERLQKDCREYVSALQSQDAELSKINHVVEEYREMFDSCLRTGGERLREIAKLKQERDEFVEIVCKTLDKIGTAPCLMEAARLRKLISEPNPR